MYDIVNILDKGRIIAFWSPVHRQGTTSAITALVASYASSLEENNGSKMLLMSNELYGSPTAIQYITNEQLPATLTEIVDLSRTDNLRSFEGIYNNSGSNIKNLDILQSVKRSASISHDLSEQIKHILDVAKTGYKYIFVDTVAGTIDATTSEILRNADVVIVCMPQDKFIWENWTRKMDGTFHRAIENKQYLMVSASHYEYKYLPYKKLAKDLGDEDLVWVSQNELVKSSAETRNILSMMKQELKNKPEKRDDCIKEVEILYKFMLKKIDIVKRKEISLEKELEEKAEQENADRLNDLIGLFDESMGGIDLSQNEVAPEKSSDKPSDTKVKKGFLKGLFKKGKEESKALDKEDELQLNNSQTENDLSNSQTSDSQSSDLQTDLSDSQTSDLQTDLSGLIDDTDDFV